MQASVAVFCAASLCLSSTAANAQPSAKTPTAKWVVNFDRSQCVASRNYGSESEPVVLFLKAPALGAVMQLGILRSGKGGRYADQLDAKISIDGAALTRTSMLAVMTGQPGTKLFRINLPLEQFKTVSTAKTLTIEGSRELRESFVLTNMDSLLKIMNQCVIDLRKVWNIAEDKGSPSTHKQRVGGNLVGLFRPDDYPATAMDTNATGKLQFVLLIDEAGKVADCTVTETSGIAALDAQSCAIVAQRARFRPAVGADGKAAKDAVLQSISWKIE